MAKRTQVVGGKRGQPTAPSAMKKAYEVLTEKAIIGGVLKKIGDKVHLTIEEATKHRERGVGLRFPQESK